jgi:hypothetical protein
MSCAQSRTSRRISALPILAIGAISVCALAPQRSFQSSHTAELLEASSALPASLAAKMLDPIGYAQTTRGDYLVLDRRAHTVYGIDAKQTTIRKILQVGFEQGSVLEPGVMALSRADVFAVADAPAGQERIQIFNLDGVLIAGFYLPTKVSPRIVAGHLVLSGLGSMQYTGTTFLVSRPEAGALFQEIDHTGRVLRQIGALRATGQESNPDVHLALNTGIPLVDPAGGFVFVFQAGVPVFRKYDAAGTLVYERHIEGVELDERIHALPTTWPARPGADSALPVVEPIIRTAAVDASGQLWISLTAPYTYVYDAAGDKRRTVQFKGREIVSPASLTFAGDGRVLVTPGCYAFSAR